MHSTLFNQKNKQRLDVLKSFRKIFRMPACTHGVTFDSALFHCARPYIFGFVSLAFCCDFVQRLYFSRHRCCGGVTCNVSVDIPWKFCIFRVNYRENSDFVFVCNTQVLRGINNNTNTPCTGYIWFLVFHLICSVWFFFRLS